MEKTIEERATYSASLYGYSPNGKSFEPYREGFMSGVREEQASHLVQQSELSLLKKTISKQREEIEALKKQVAELDEETEALSDERDGFEEEALKWGTEYKSQAEEIERLKGILRNFTRDF